MNESISNFLASTLEIADTNPTIRRELEVANICRVFASIIVNAGVERQISVEEVAEKAACSVEQIHTIENPGPGNTPNIADMMGACLALNLSLKMKVEKSTKNVIVKKKSYRHVVSGGQSE